MRDSQLREVLRRALWTALGGPVALGLAACGGSVSGSPSTEVDSGHPDVDSGHPEADSGHPKQDSGPPELDSGHPQVDAYCVGGCDCSAGYVAKTACVDGNLQCQCIPINPPPVDAGDPCHPTTSGCGGSLMPAYCFDGGIPTPPDSGNFSYEQCQVLCSASSTNFISGCNVQDTPAGPELNCFAGCTGRRPPGMCATRSRGGRGGHVGRFFAEAAQLEAASIDAFKVLARELRAHGAPAALLVRTEEARRDEVRHARMTARLARRYGSRPVRAHVRRTPVRSLEALAIENAIEGCVRETFGAVFAMHQAETSSDPEVRAAMAQVAPDEVRHAALGWAVAEWADSQLDEDARTRVRAAQREAVASLRKELETEVPSDLVQVAGLPASGVALHMFDVLTASLWA